jgi:hypothetical protein
MAGFRKSKAIRPTSEDAVALKAEEERGDIWTMLPGRVKSFDPASQTITAEVMYKPRHNGEPVAMPDLLEVPVVLQRGGGFTLTHPIKPGDGVQLMFQARNMDNWHGNGEAAEAATGRMHDLSDAVAIVGLEPSPKKLANYNANNFEIRSDDGKNKIEISADGKFAFTGAGGSQELLAILDAFMAVMQTHTNLGASHDQNPQVGALRARLAQIRL